MSYSYSKTSVTIAEAGTLSDELDLTTFAAGKLLTVTIFAPGTLTGTVTVRVAPSPGGTYRTLVSGGSDVAVAAAKAVPLTEVNAGALKLLSNGAEAAARIFEINVTARE